ncbi:SRPBCC domain-containing protein [Sediminibacterium soli]|uniref:SRPBCC domain-containing protein n=1 Tax=Sediminibacterium soli TaxID=2698829 RepID=UPI00137B8182|nr:SRPBCC domain-containing protein [Sediminibacterium soli]NCI47881.1 ATPase [Sediminibacterium soli]
MEQKTRIHAEDGKQELLITRDFALPLPLLFTAYTDPEIVAQWMGTRVLTLDNRVHGSWRFETTDPKGNKHGFNGVIHEFETNRKITRTFEMENTPFSPWIEYLEFESLDGDTSRLTMQPVYRSVEQRDRLLQLPFAQGIQMAHNRIQEIFSKPK